LEEAMDLSRDRLGASDVVHVTADSKSYVGDSVLLGYNAACMGNWIRLATDMASYPRRNYSSAVPLQNPKLLKAYVIINLGTDTLELIQ
jgi:hypothetical protein